MSNYKKYFDTLIDKKKNWNVERINTSKLKNKEKLKVAKI